MPKHKLQIRYFYSEYRHVYSRLSKQKLLTNHTTYFYDSLLATYLAQITIGNPKKQDFV